MPPTSRTTLERPLASVDTVVLTEENGVLSVALVKRTHDPFKDFWALPGGIVRPHSDRSVEDTARAVLARRLGPSRFHIEQLATFSGPDRDPDGWSICVAHLAVVPRSALCDMKRGVRLFPASDLPEVAFDHAQIIAAAVARLRGKGAYSTLPAGLLDEVFTLPEMERAYEVALGARIDSSSFRRKIRDLDILEALPPEPAKGRGRPPARYRLKSGIDAFNRTLSTGG